MTAFTETPRQTQAKLFHSVKRDNLPKPEFAEKNKPRKVQRRRFYHRNVLLYTSSNGSHTHSVIMTGLNDRGSDRYDLRFDERQRTKESMLSFKFKCESFPVLSGMLCNAGVVLLEGGESERQRETFKPEGERSSEHHGKSLLCPQHELQLQTLVKENDLKSSLTLNTVNLVSKRFYLCTCCISCTWTW